MKKLIYFIVTSALLALFALSSASAAIEFTNKYGTERTLCAHQSCDNYISKTGDTNCCMKHSSKCLNCNAYIDEDASYCMDCLTSTIGKTSSKAQSGSSYSSSFTNEYGTATTKCAHKGCKNYIANTGDTNCCETHSNTCLNCGKYIDEDALYCMNCLFPSTGKSSDTSKSYSSSSSKSSSKANSYSSSSSKSSSSKSSYGSSSSLSYGTCQYKENGQYVCSQNANSSGYCSYHKNYLDQCFNMFFGN